MKIAAYGTGGVGGFSGGKLAYPDVDVCFIARGVHLEALQAHGLQVASMRGDFVVHPVTATNDQGQAGPVDRRVAAKLAPLGALLTFAMLIAARGVGPQGDPQSAVMLASANAPAPVLASEHVALLAHMGATSFHATAYVVNSGTGQPTMVSPPAA